MRTGQERSGREGSATHVPAAQATRSTGRDRRLDPEGTMIRRHSPYGGILHEVVEHAGTLYFGGIVADARLPW